MAHNRRVLIVDDQRGIHDDFRKLLAAAAAPASAALEQTILGESPLASVDYEIESAYQGEAGLEAVRHARASGRPFALAIVDARMPPGWDGLLTVEKIFEADAEIQAVICTAYSDTRWHELQRRFGVSDRLIILKKPFDPTEACQLVGAMTEKWNIALKRRQAMQALVAAEESARESHAALQERTIELERRTTELSQMASDLTLADQHAREELAQQLHDGLQQMLTVAVMKLEGHIMRVAQRGTVADELVQAKAQLDEAIAAARSLSMELFPPVLHTSGLPSALGWLADLSRSKYGLEVKVSADPRADSDRKDVRTLLFGSVRELLFNVVKHAHVNQATVDLALGANDTLCITVTDEGLGFDPVEVDERARVHQVGWGLFSIRERLTLLGGRFDVKSAPGRGTTFRLIAPRDVAHRPVGAESPLSDAASATPAQAVGGAPPYALTILIADDQPALRETFRELLHTRPEFQVVGEAANGLEAIAQAHVLRPDVVLMDVSMPEMDGVEATRRIRAELPFIRVLGFSISPEGVPHAIEVAGAEGFFTKGTDTARLIDHLLDKHASLRSDHSGQST